MQITKQPAQAMLLQHTAGTTNILLSFREAVPNPQRLFNVALVIDRNGSIAGTLLRYALKAAEFVDRLIADDRLSIMVYNDNVNTLLDAQLVTDKAVIKQILSGVRTGGLTNLRGDWLRGFELVARHQTERHINRVLLLTNGQANVGITNANVLISTATQKVETNISTTTLGFGEHFGGDLLIGTARAAGGNFYCRSKARQTPSGLNGIALKLVAAQNLTVTLHPLGATQLTGMLSLARTEPQVDGWLVVRLGDVYENEDKLLGLQLRLPALVPSHHDLIRLSYRADVIRQGMLEVVSGEHRVQGTAGPLEAVVAATDSRVTLELTMLRIDRDRERAVDLADAGQHAQAKALPHQVIADLRTAGLHEHFEIDEEIDQLTHYAERIAHLDNASRRELRDQAFQGRQARQDTGRDLSMDAAYALPIVSDPNADDVELACFRQGGTTRMRVVPPCFANLNVQFPHTICAEGAHYSVEGLEHRHWRARAVRAG